MKISIIIPTNRTSYAAIARVLEIAALDPGKFELIVRDNSENTAKRDLLARIESPTVKLTEAPNRGATENAVEALRLATGDFAYFLADDDWLSVIGLSQLHALAAKHASDDSVVCVTGTYLIETVAGSGFLRYTGVDSHDANQRLEGYIKANAPNVLYYSAVRRSLLTFCMDFVNTLPYKFSFHDISMVLLYLASGRTLQVDRVVYTYDQSEWETTEGTLAKDRAWYAKAGLPIETDRLHWLICGLEGALMLKSSLLGGNANYDAEQLSNLWFAAMFSRFRHWNREFGWNNTPVNEAAKKLSSKWVMQPEVNLH